MGLGVEDKLAEIVGQSPYFASKYLAKILNCCNNTITGRVWLQEHVVNWDTSLAVPFATAPNVEKELYGSQKTVIVQPYSQPCINFFIPDMI